MKTNCLPLLLTVVAAASFVWSNILALDQNDVGKVLTSEIVLNREHTEKSDSGKKVAINARGLKDNGNLSKAKQKGHSKKEKDLKSKKSKGKKSGKAKKAKSKGTIGFSIPGGSMTTANNGSGLMRGFQQQKININGEKVPALSTFDYIAGVSGGAIATFQYAFAQNTNSDILLDADGINEPSEITTEELKNIPEKSVFSQYNISVKDSLITVILMAVSGQGDNIWSDFISLYTFAKFGIPSGKKMGLGKKSDEFLVPRDDVKAIPVSLFQTIGPAEMYPEWSNIRMGVDVENDFLENVDSMAKFTFPATEFSPAQTWAVKDNSVILDYVKEADFQMPIPSISTPANLTIPFVAGEMKFDPIAGKTADSINFKPFTVDTSEAGLTVEKLVGASTNLVPIWIESGLTSLFPPVLQQAIANPLTFNMPTDDGEKRSMATGDGALPGIASLVSLKVRNIISLVQKTVPLIDPTNPPHPPLKCIEELRNLFGVIDPITFDNARSFKEKLLMTHIFDIHSNGENQLIKLYNNLNSLYEAGNPMITTLEDLTVVNNPFWGTVSGEKVNLTVIYLLDVPQKFSEKVPYNVAPPPVGKRFKENGFFTNEDLVNVPNMQSGKTLVLNETIPLGPGVPDFVLQAVVPALEIAIGVEESRMSQILCSWMIKEAWNGLKGADGEIKFRGFREIFE